MFVFCCIVFSAPAFALENDFLYFMNLAYHQNEQLCEYKQPEAQFFVFVNRDTSRLLFENAPRWSSIQDENISGKGYFGVELGNFIDPAIQVGDTIHLVFTCQPTEEQVTASDPVTAIPWHRWPLHLVMQPQDFPKTPKNFSLKINSMGERVLSWDLQPGVQYDLYRTQYDLELENGIHPQIYERIASNILQDSFIDTTEYGTRHGYILLPRQNRIFGGHTAPEFDFPEPVGDVQALVSHIPDTTLTLSWTHPESDELIFRVYRDSVGPETLLSEAPDPYFQHPVELYSSYSFRIVAVNAVENASDPVPVEVFTEPPVTTTTDLDLLFISRSPKFPRYEVVYEPGGYNPAIDPETRNIRHSPTSGQMMVYTATIQNKGSVPADAFTAEWRVDSQPVENHQFEGLQSGQKITTSLQWPWSEQPQNITCRLISDDVQVTTRNDQITIRSNALSFHFHVEKNIKDLFDTHKNPVDSYSFEDWARYHVDYLNHYIRSADYPQGPPEVFEALFLDTVSVYENGALSSGGTHAPDDLLWDGRWGFTGDENAMDYFENSVLGNDNGTDWALLHELGHQLGLIDLYNQDVQQNQVNVIEPRTGAKIALDPIAWDVVYYSSRKNALMHSNYRVGFSDHSAGALARNLSKRRGFFGEYLADIPAENTLLVRDPAGNPVTDAEVRVYQKQDNQIPNITKFKGQTNAEGKFRFPHRTEAEYLADFYAANPFSTEFSEAPHVVGTNATLLIRIATPEKVAYEFMDICDFNVAYWAGNQAEAEYILNIAQWIHLPETGVQTQHQSGASYTYSLEQNFPNPFNASTELSFSLQNPGKTTLSVFNITGQLVATLVDQRLPAGPHRVNWTPNLPSGTYFVRLQSANFTQLKKIILLR